MEEGNKHTHTHTTAKESLKKDLFKRYFSRILTTKCELKFESKVRLVFYGYLTLSA